VSNIFFKCPFACWGAFHLLMGIFPFHECLYLSSGSYLLCWEFIGAPMISTYYPMLPMTHTSFSMLPMSKPYHSMLLHSRLLCCINVSVNPSSHETPHTPSCWIHSLHVNCSLRRGLRHPLLVVQNIHVSHA
jgi:hypothetical protein